MTCGTLTLGLVFCGCQVEGLRSLSGGAWKTPWISAVDFLQYVFLRKFPRAVFHAILHRVPKCTPQNRFSQRSPLRSSLHSSRLFHRGFHAIFHRVLHAILHGAVFHRPPENPRTRFPREQNSRRWRGAYLYFAGLGWLDACIGIAACSFTWAPSSLASRLPRMKNAWILECAWPRNKNKNQFYCDLQAPPPGHREQACTAPRAGHVTYVPSGVCCLKFFRGDLTFVPIGATLLYQVQACCSKKRRLLV